MFNATTRRPHGYISVCDPENGMTESDTLHCPHCGGHFLVGRGKLADAQGLLGSAARPRVFCHRCGRLTCGQPGCNPEIYPCVPIEARLDHAEGRTPSSYAEAIEVLVSKVGVIL